MTNQLLVRYRDVKDCVDGDYKTTIFSTNLGSEENQDDKSTKSGKLLFHLSENTWRCHLVACYPPIWPRPEHINKTRGECLVSPISGFNIEDAPSPAISKCET